MGTCTHRLRYAHGSKLANELCKVRTQANFLHAQLPLHHAQYTAAAL
jgi:hypothetical protein